MANAVTAFQQTVLNYLHPTTRAVKARGHGLHHESSNTMEYLI